MNVARLGDITIGSCAIHGPNIRGVITSSSPTTTCNGLGTARVSDSVTAECGHVAQIISGSTTVAVDGLPIARIVDAVGASPYTATIITGSPNVTAG